GEEHALVALGVVDLGEERDGALTVDDGRVLAGVRLEPTLARQTQPGPGARPDAADAWRRLGRLRQRDGGGRASAEGQGRLVVGSRVADGVLGGLEQREALAAFHQGGGAGRECGAASLRGEGCRGGSENQADRGGDREEREGSRLTSAALHRHVPSG